MEELFETVSSDAEWELGMVEWLLQLTLFSASKPPPSTRLVWPSQFTFQPPREWM